MATSSRYVPTAAGLFLRPLEIDQREEPSVSAQESQWQDDQERDHGQEGGEQRDPTKQPPTHQEGERKIGDQGQEQGSETPRGDEGEHDEDAERARRNEDDSIEHGHETPA